MIRDLCSDRPGRTPAEVWELLYWLPDTGPMAASLSGGRDELGNGYDRMLWRAAADAARLHTWVTVRANAGKKGSGIKRPDPIPDTSELAKESRQKRPRMTVADLVRMRDKGGL